MVWNKVPFSPKFLENAPQYCVRVARLWSHGDSRGGFCEKLPVSDRTKAKKLQEAPGGTSELAHPKMGKGEGKWTVQLEIEVSVWEK